MNKDWYNEYQKSNKEEFNKEFIYGRNTNEDLQDILSEIYRTAAEISRKAAGPDKIVMASLGPRGKFLIILVMYDYF